MKKIGLIMILLINLVFASSFISATPTEEEVKMWEQKIRDDPTAIKDMSREEIKWVRSHLILQAFEQLLEDNLSIHMFVLEPQRELRITSFRKDIKLMLPHTGLDHLEIVNLPALREVFEGYFQKNFPTLQDEKTEVWFWDWYEQNLIVDWGSSDYSFSLTSSTNDLFLREAETNDPEGYERFMGVVGELPSDNENLMVYLYGFIVKRIFENDHLKSLDDFTRSDIVLTGMSSDPKPGKVNFATVSNMGINTALSLPDYFKKNFPEGEFIPFKDLTYPEKVLLSIYYDKIYFSFQSASYEELNNFHVLRQRHKLYYLMDLLWLDDHLYVLYNSEEQRGETGVIHDPITLGVGWDAEVDIALVNLKELTFGKDAITLSLTKKNDGFTSINIGLQYITHVIRNVFDLEVGKGNQIIFFNTRSSAPEIEPEPLTTETKELGTSAITGQVTAETIEPVIVFPTKSQFGGSVGVAHDMNIDGTKYVIHYNDNLVENGFLYPHTMLRKFDEEKDGVLTKEELEKGSKSDDECKLCVKTAKDFLEKYSADIQALPFSTDTEKAEAAEKIACEREGGLLDVNGNEVPCSEVAEDETLATDVPVMEISPRRDLNIEPVISPVSLQLTDAQRQLFSELADAQEKINAGDTSAIATRDAKIEELKDQHSIDVYTFAPRKRDESGKSVSWAAHWRSLDEVSEGQGAIKVVVNDKKITSDKPVVIPASGPTSENELTAEQRRLFARLANAQEKLTLGDKKAIATRDNLIKELSDTHKIDVYQADERQTDDNGRKVPWYQHWRQLGRGVDIAKKVEELKKRIEKYEAKKDKERVYVLIDKKHDLHLVSDDNHAQAAIEVDDQGYITLDASEIDKDTKISFEKQKRELSSLFIKKQGSFTIKEDGSIPWHQKNDAKILADTINMKVLTYTGVYYFEEGGVDHYLSVADELSKIEEIQQKINDKNCEEEWDKGGRTQLSRECDQLSLERDRLYLEAAKKLSKTLYYRGTLTKDEYKALEDKYEELLAEKIRNKKLQALKATILSKAQWIIKPENEALSLQNLNIETTYERGQNYTRLAELQERINELDKKGKDKTITEEEMKEYGLVVIERDKLRKQMRAEGDPWIDRRGNMNADEWYRHLASLAPEAPPEEEQKIPERPLPEPYIVKVGEGLTLAAAQIPASCRAINCHWTPELVPQKLPEEHPPKGFLVEITNAETGEVTRYVAETGDLPEVPEDGRYAVKITNLDTGTITTMIEAPNRMEKDYSIPITSLIGNYWKIMALSWP